MLLSSNLPYAGFLFRSAAQALIQTNGDIVSQTTVLWTRGSRQRSCFVLP
jgi:hypothetical protein